MKAEGLVLLVIGAFFAVVALVYWFWSGETSGTAMLTGAFLLGLLPGSYYFWWSRRMRPRPEDDPHAEREEGAGVVGAFPSSSIWPFVLGLSAASVGLALVFGFWTAIVGFVVAVAAVIGVIRESRRGGVV
ncbi:MAG TPA: cytochrome c oxidase subunit 4 [Acidimicrobiales bacterium]|nr:cytochrome c oxidase subunit 4 [Acidimicrobiales bacterium]